MVGEQLLRMNHPEKVWLLKHTPDPRVRSYLKSITPLDHAAECGQCMNGLVDFPRRLALHSGSLTMTRLSEYVKIAEVEKQTRLGEHGRSLVQSARFTCKEAAKPQEVNHEDYALPA